jgi:hypothetical protein
MRTRQDGVQGRVGHGIEWDTGLGGAEYRTGVGH